MDAVETRVVSAMALTVRNLPPISAGKCGTALGGASVPVAANATLPAWWQDWPARTHVRRWIDHLGLTEDRIIETAIETRRDHPNPPDGPKALDRAMERAARRDAQAAADTAKAQQPRKARVRDVTPRSSPDDLAAFYADLVNSDRHLPANAISNTTRDAMLARGLVTPERLRQRGVR